MDSLTQIVLGAACGEAVAGKKLGNKALLWGAMGGTIPDLDVFVGNLLYSDKVDRLVFHRGFMHSFAFAPLSALAMALLFFYLNKRFRKKSSMQFKDWWWLWFLSIFTHPILDSFTAYGTQVFQPFSNYRLAFNNISVVDLFYTLPFLFLLIALMFYKRTHKTRKKLLFWAIGASSVYMFFTICNKFYINNKFENALESHKISFKRMTNQPSLFTNFLWFGIAESENKFYYGFYSLFDHSPIKFDSINKSKPLRNELNGSVTYDKLKWFSNNFHVLQKNDSAVIFNDVRYPIFESKNVKRSVFSFKLKKNSTKEWKMIPFEPEFEDKDLLLIFERIAGE